MVTTSQARIANMIDDIRSLTPDGSGWRQFLFTDHDTLIAAPDLLSLEWLNSKGETVRLTD